MGGKKIVGLVLVAIALLLFFPALFTGFYERYVEEFILIVAAPLRGHADTKTLFLCWVALLGVVGGIMFFKK